MSPPTPKVVTSTTAPAPVTPHYPPPSRLPFPARPLNVVPPDIKTIVPATAAQAAPLAKVEDIAAATEGGVVSAARSSDSGWTLDSMFNGQQLQKGRNEVPMSDPFSIYLAATLSRFIYRLPVAGTLEQDAIGYISNVLGGATVQKVIGPGGGRYDLWQIGTRYKILAICGTTKLDQWLSYANPQMVSKAYLPTDWQVFAGIGKEADNLRPLSIAHDTGVDPNSCPAIFVGHSLGGAVAQILAAAINLTFSQSAPAFPTKPLVRTLYTFGAPAWLLHTRTTTVPFILKTGVRCYLESDPVVHATQIWLANNVGNLPIAGLLAPGYVRAALTTQHYSAGHYEMFPLQGGDRASAITSALRAVLLPIEQLTLQLIQRHSIEVYCASAYERCLRADARVPAKEFEQLNEANARITQMFAAPSEFEL